MLLVTLVLCWSPIGGWAYSDSPLWGSLARASSRTEAESSLDALKDANVIRLWRSAELQPRYAVSVEQLQSATRCPDVADAFGIYGSQQLEKILFSVVLSAIFAFGAATVAGETLTFLPEIVRFTVVQALSASPFVVLGVGIASPENFMRSLTTTYAKISPAYRARLARHEAGHVLVGHLLGLPLAAVSTNAAAAAAQFYDLQIEQRATMGGAKLASAPRFASPGQLEAIAVVSLAGIMAEIRAFGQSEGGAADLGQLQEIYDRAGLDAEAQLETTRWAALQAFLLLKRHAIALETLVDAFVNENEENIPVTVAIAALENETDFLSEEDNTRWDSLGPLRQKRLQELRRRNRVLPNAVERLMAVQGSSLDDDDDSPVTYDRSPPKQSIISPEDVPLLAFGVTMCFLFYAINGGITLH